MRILLIEDDAKTAEFILKGLRQENYAVDHTTNGEDGLHQACTTPYDAAVVDVMLPKLDGLEVIRKMRNRGVQTPVIILSARSTVHDRVCGLQAGGDDYLVKPFAFSELTARIQALLRRSAPVNTPMTLSVGDLTMDLVRRKIFRGGVSIELQPKEMALLEYLMRNTGRVISKTMIMEHVWDYNFDPQTNVVESRICRLRDKIDRPFREKLIHTIRGIGYVLEKKT
ncbi:MAG: response regulator transcription factor [Deltaproteobacteria bacterium]|nr:response regulator transcription factor [Deltaproteobacteria bacterium]